MFRTSKVRSFAAIALAATLALAPAIAEARAGLGGSFGSRGSRTFSAPRVTNTAPRAAAPIQRSATPQSQPGFGATRPASAPNRGFFGAGFGRGLLGGLLGAGLLGLLMGHGFFGGLGSLMSMLGLLLQLALVFLVARWAFNRFFASRQPAPAGAARSPLGGAMGLGSGNGPAPMGGGAFGASAQLTVQSEDYSAFERLLDEAQHAFADEDVAKLQTITTPEMLSYFGDDIAEMQRKGEANRVSGVKLLQGDLSEAWRENGADYATVAMRFSMVDTTIERTSGRLVSGDTNGPVEATEVWTFQRPSGSTARDWKISAIQQV